MRGHRPTQRGSATQRRRRTLSGGPPINLETIVESPAPLNPNHPHWWRRRASIDSSQSGDYDNDGNRSEVSSISTADTRKRLNKNHSEETDGDYGGYKTADDGYDNMDGSLKSMDSIDLAQQTIMVVHSMPSKVPARPSPPQSPPEVDQYHSSPEHTPKGNKKGHRRRSSFPPPATPTNSDEVIDEHSTNNNQQLTPPISNSTSHFSPTPQDRSDRSGKSTKGSGPHRRPSISDKSINSITFLPDKNESDSYSDESNGSTNSDDMEVMDLRPQQGAGSSWENSSMVSFSEFSMDSELASGLFQAQGYLSDGSKGKVHTQGNNRLPTEHWVAATHTAHGTLNESQAQAAAARAAARARGVNTDVGASFATSTGSGGSAGRLTGRRWTEGGNDLEGGGGNALGESEQAYRALMSLMGHNQPTSPSPLGSSVNTSDFHPGLANFTPGTTASGGRGSMMSVASQSSGFWSAMGDLTADNSSVCTDVSDETSLVMKKKRQVQRSIYIKRCARAMMILVVLSLVSCTAIYFIAGDGDMVLPFGLSNRFKSSSSSSQEAMPHLVQDDRDLVQDITDPQDAQQQQDPSMMIEPQDDTDTTNPLQGMTSQEIERYQRENRPGIKYGEEHKRELKERNMKLRAERIKKRKEQRIGKRRKAAEVKAAKTDNANRRAMVEGSRQDDQGGGPQVDGYDYFAGDEWQNHQNVLNQEHTIGGYTATHPLTIQQQDGQQQGYDYYTQDEWQANQQQATAGRQLSIQEDEYWATQQQAQQQQGYEDGGYQQGYYYAPQEYHYR